MAETVKITDNQLAPGDTIRFEFELLTDNQTIAGEAVSSVKKTIWADDRLDYQGSETEGRVDLETGTNYQILSIYATVRKTRRDQRGEIKYVELSNVEATVMAAVVVWGQSVKYVKAKVIRFAGGVKDFAGATADTAKSVAAALPTLSLGVLLIAAVVAYAFFFGLPKQSH